MDTRELKQNNHIADFNSIKEHLLQGYVERPKILVVDDRIENLIATRKILKNVGADIIEADSGNQALSKMLHHRFAVVLLDVQMPEMDGFEVAALMQEQDTMKHTPIIFVTAISKEECYVDQAAEIGAVDYIFKPINPNILKSKVKVYVDLYLYQEYLKRLNQVLTKNNEELEMFAYICSHDLQEPVRMMGSFSQLLLENYTGLLDEQGKKYLELVNKNANNMRKMVNDILVYSRVGSQKVEVEKVNCQSIVQEILQEFKIEIKQKQATIFRDDLPIIYACKSLIEVLFKNLISNSLKFYNTDKSLKITIKATETEHAWLFSVIDNGIGIAPEFKKKVFTMFQRIHRKEEYPGTGIGLSTCSKFIEHYGGKIWFESKLNQGSTFFFTIPKSLRDVFYGDGKATGNSID